MTRDQFIKIFSYESRCDEEHLAMLRRCSEKKDVSEWNRWRKENHDVEICLQNADLSEIYLEGADLWNARLEGTDLSYSHLGDAEAIGACLEGANFREARLEGANLVKAQLAGANLARISLSGADLREARLENTYLMEAHLENANLSGACLDGADLTEACLEGADLTQADLEDANLSGAILQGADLRGADLEGCNLSGAHLEGADLTGTRLEGANLSNARLEGANLRGASLRTANLAGANLEGANLWDAHLEEADLREACLQSADLIRTCLRGADLSKARLEGANLSEAHLEGANLWGASLEFAKVWKAHLEKANLWEVRLVNADFWKAHLEEANLSETRLEGANLSEAHLEGARFQAAVVDSRTIISDCFVDDNTDFSLVGLHSARISPSLLASLQTNIRRFEWRKHCKRQRSPKALRATHPWRFRCLKFCFDLAYLLPAVFMLSILGQVPLSVQLLLCPALTLYPLTYPRRYLKCLSLVNRNNFSGLFMTFFWWISDYGSNTKRVLCVFFSAAAVFSIFYAFIDVVYPGILQNSANPNAGIVWYLQIFAFAVSTMVTLGFGSVNVMVDSAHLWASGFALIVVVANLLFGYFLLAVLITRIGILFQSLGPEQKPEKRHGKI